MKLPHPRATLLPYTTLFRSKGWLDTTNLSNVKIPVVLNFKLLSSKGICAVSISDKLQDFTGELLDRKSTRLNSSHVSISYAVFCLKKKTNLVTKHIHTSDKR